MSKALELAGELEDKVENPFEYSLETMANAASELRRLAEIERKYNEIMAQEPFGEIKYEIDSDNWPTNLQFISTHSSGADWVDLPNGTKLYTLPKD